MAKTRDSFLPLVTKGEKKNWITRMDAIIANVRVASKKANRSCTRLLDNLPLGNVGRKNGGKGWRALGSDVSINITNETPPWRIISEYFRGWTRVTGNLTTSTRSARCSYLLPPPGFASAEATPSRRFLWFYPFLYFNVLFFTTLLRLVSCNWYHQWSNVKDITYNKYNIAYDC